MGGLWEGPQWSLKWCDVSGPSNQNMWERNSRSKAWREPLRTACRPGARDTSSSTSPAPSAWSWSGQSQEETDGGGRGEAGRGRDSVGWSRARVAEGDLGQAVCRAGAGAPPVGPRPSPPPTVTPAGPVSQAPFQEDSHRVWPGAGTSGRLGCGGERPGLSSPSLCPVWHLH